MTMPKSVNTFEQEPLRASELERRHLELRGDVFLRALKRNCPAERERVEKAREAGFSPGTERPQVMPRNTTGYLRSANGWTWV